MGVSGAIVEVGYRSQRGEKIQRRDSDLVPGRVRWRLCWDPRVLVYESCIADKCPEWHRTRVTWVLLTNPAVWAGPGRYPSSLLHSAVVWYRVEGRLSPGRRGEERERKWKQEGGRGRRVQGSPCPQQLPCSPQLAAAFSLRFLRERHLAVSKFRASKFRAKFPCSPPVTEWGRRGPRILPGAHSCVLPESSPPASLFFLRTSAPPHPCIHTSAHVSLRRRAVCFHLHLKSVKLCHPVCTRWPALDRTPHPVPRTPPCRCSQPSPLPIGVLKTNESQWDF